jgi:hypothetical protein
LPKEIVFYSLGEDREKKGQCLVWYDEKGTQRTWQCLNIEENGGK